QIRCFTTSMTRPFAKLVRPPIQLYGLEGRYATALYSAASKQNNLDAVEKELIRVTKLLKEPKTVASFMNLYIKHTIKMADLNDLIAKEKFSAITTNFMKLFAENGHLNNTPRIISAFSTIMSVHHGELPCSVTTASALDSSTLSELEAVLNNFLHKGQVLKMEANTYPSILEGMIVRIGEKYVDMSTRTKIQKLNRIMRESV
uniref:ATP synthase peripheral stalk subunit OSCP, mitochondrial n=1 Tax=Monodelphis domestica TaxID=13616 RepID=F6R948_MONDO